MKRLTGLDASFLYLETPTMHMHVALIAVLDPSTAPHGYSFERIQTRVELEIRRRPEFQQRLVEVPFGLDHPYWMRDPHFDPIHHIRRVGCPAPHGMAELAELAARILSTPLDRSRPLWELWVVEGLADGQYALVAKVHHAIADGMTGASLLSSMFVLSPDVPDPVLSPETPSEEALLSELDLLREAVIARLQKRKDLSQLLRRTTSALSDFYARRQSGEHPAGATLLDAPRTRWNGAITAPRSAAFARVPKRDISAIRKRYGVTSNDVVLAVCASVLRGDLVARGELPKEPLVAACPVAVRAGGRSHGHNHISALFTSLATHIEDPEARLMAIRAGSRAAKAEHDLLGHDMVTSWAELMSPSLFTTAARLYTKYRIAERHRPLYNVAISHVPGPRVPLYFAGAKLVGAYPLGPVVEGVGLNMTVLTYADQVDFGFLAAAKLLPNVHELAARVPSAVCELMER